VKGVRRKKPATNIYIYYIYVVSKKPLARTCACELKKCIMNLFFSF